MYKEATETNELCNELLAENQEDDETKYKKLRKKKTKRKFLRMCMWMNLYEENGQVSLNDL